MAYIEDDVVRQVISDFDGIKTAIEESNVAVPYGTDTKDYGEYIKEIPKRKPYIDSSKITDFSRICYNQRLSIKEVAKLDTSNGENFDYAFYGCRADEYKTFPKLDWTKCTSATQAFRQCQFTETIEEIKFSTVKTSAFNNTFVNMNTLENITISGKIKVDSNSLNFSMCPKITAESIMSIINALEDNTGEETTYTVYFGSDNLAKLSEEQKKVALDKNIDLE